MSGKRKVINFYSPSFFQELHGKGEEMGRWERREADAETGREINLKERKEQENMNKIMEREGKEKYKKIKQERKSERKKEIEKK